MKITAAFLIIGEEILSGRTNDKNLNFLALGLGEIGIELREARVIGDEEDEIIGAINDLRQKYDYVFTSGGIGPTHDDITSGSIAKAFGVEIELNQEAEEILHKHYGVEINEARLKMAMIPKGASLLDNPVSSAPGFFIENVFVMAGVPKIFQAMFFAAKKELKTGKKTESREFKTNLVESRIAKDFANLQKQYPNVAMGSYPFAGGTALSFRSKNYDELDEAFKKMQQKVEEILAQKSSS
jgi:molybdenum cofactor synthesis domain-containing protein